MRRLILSACLLAPVAAAWGQSGVIDVPMDKGWGATPEWAPYEKAATFSQTYADGAASFRASGGGRVMIWCHNPLPRLDVSRMRYVTLRYRLTDTDPTLYSYLLYLDTGDSGTMLARNLIFGANDLIHDGQWHVATTTLYPFGQVGSMALRFQALEGKEGRLDVAYLRFTADPPRQALRETLAWRPG